jgi:arylsulfatase A-like enzyme
MDALRADHVHAYGYARQTTPVLDRLVRQGAAFTRCYAQGGWTAPSGAGVLSSQYPSATGIRKMRDPLNPAIPWLPEILRGKGFETAGFSAIYQVSKLRGFDRGFDVFCDLFKDSRTMQRCRDRGQDARGDDYCLPLSEDVHARALEWLDGRADPGAPFFLFLWSIDTHEPFRQPARCNVDVDPAYRGHIDGTGRPFRWIRHRGDLQQVIDLYDGALRYQDEQLGLLIEELARRGVWEDTLLVVFGDHGEMFFEHGIAGHGKFPWEGELRVPLVLHHPKAGPTGVRCDAPVHLLDVAPTVLDVLDLPAVRGFRGQSLRPVLEGRTDRVHEAIVLDLPFPHDREEHARVVLEDRWKYIEYVPPPRAVRVRRLWKEFWRALSVLLRPRALPILFGHRFQRGLRGFLQSCCVEPIRFLLGRPTRQLYDVQADPWERIDRLGDRPDIADRLVQRLAVLNEQSSGNERAAPACHLEAEDERKIVDHLRRLGYLD